MASVFLSGLDADFIAPSQACTNPLFAEGAADRAPRAEGAAVLTLSLEEEDVGSGGPVRPDLIKSAAGKATVSLNDCLACSGCVTSAEAVLISSQSIDTFQRLVASGDFDQVVVSVSPQARAALAEATGLEHAEFFPRLVTYLRAQGANYVIDATLGSDFTLVEAAREFVARFKEDASMASMPSPPAATSIEREFTPPPPARRKRPLPGSPPPPGSCLPVLSSTCPGWVCFAEKTQPDALPYLSAVKSPQQILGTLVKRLGAESEGLDPRRILHVTLMPCYDKKLEASRPDFVHPVVAEGDSTYTEVDLVLTTEELVRMLQASAQAAAVESHIDYFRQLEPAPTLPASGAAASIFDMMAEATQAHSDAANLAEGQPSGVFSPTMHHNSSDGLADFVFRHAARELFGVEQDPLQPLDFTTTRNSDILELALRVDDRVVLKFAIINGFRNITSLVSRIRRGICDYHFVEVMACPSGCINGGAQPKPPPSTEMSRQRTLRVGRTMQALQAPLTHRNPQENPFLQQIYRTWPTGSDGVSAQVDVFRTQFKAVPKSDTPGLDAASQSW
mmetsp:Transcript_13352/g.38820  ORF Transcript_13352/g.38820 Transcript_13352/m.38820 type:complete len:563 (-) Transcript_13352:487-2175(-)